MNLRDDIEAARARGLNVPETVMHLNVPPATVMAVWDRMDELNVEQDVAVAACRPLGIPLGDALRPHGTHAAFQRHKGRGQTPCPTCRVGERAYQAERGRRRRAVARRTAAEVSG